MSVPVPIPSAIPLSNSIDALQILRTNSFYSNAWLMVMGFFAFAGIVVPLFINWYQQKNAKLEKRDIELQLKNEVGKMFDNYKTNFEKQMEEFKCNIKNNINSIADSSVGVALYYQAVQAIYQKEYYISTHILLQSYTIIYK